jgi:hypothetical protein
MLNKYYGEECTFKLLAKYQVRSVKHISFYYHLFWHSWNILWSKSNTWTAIVRSNICQIWDKKNAFFVSIQRCVYNETFNMYHKWLNIKTWFQILSAVDLDKPRRLANCKLYSRLCFPHSSVAIFCTSILFYGKRSYSLSWKISANLRNVL